MKFFSLNDHSLVASFAEAIMQGQAPDGGLYFPSHIPLLGNDALKRLAGADQSKVAMQMLSPWLIDEMTEVEIESVIEQAAIFPTPIREVDGRYVLELFHGPTLAFKDVGARYLAAFMSHFNKKNSNPITILVATSGDTGGGIAQAFSEIPNIQVVVLFPKGRVSKLQYEQLTRAGSNIFSLELEGSFDDCQDLVKKAFNDTDLNDIGLTSANSINIGRLLPQTTYYGSAFAQLNREDLRFVVPTGNLGNLTAGVIAKKAGIPISSFVAANNQNNSVHRYLETGIYEPNISYATMSNAMDVGAPNNLPRLQHLFGNDVKSIRNEVKSTTVTDEETVETIKSVYQDHGYLLDPHTAVAWTASKRLHDPAKKDVVIATASPLKFAEEIERLTGIKIDNSKELKQLAEREVRLISLKANYFDFKEFLMEKI